MPASRCALPSSRRRWGYASARPLVGMRTAVGWSTPPPRHRDRWDSGAVKANGLLPGWPRRHLPASRQQRDEGSAPNAGVRDHVGLLVLGSGWRVLWPGVVVARSTQTVHNWVRKAEVDAGTRLEVCSSGRSAPARGPGRRTSGAARRPVGRSAGPAGEADRPGDETLSSLRRFFTRQAGTP